MKLRALRTLKREAKSAFISVLHRGNAIETGPLGDFLGSEFLAAPRADNDVWRVMDYF
jgi:hypothetical protein